MARVSFTLRHTAETSSQPGSSVRYDPGLSYEASASLGVGASVPVLVDYDSALRADGLQLAPAEFEEFFLEGTSVCYGEVSLSWAINLQEPGTLPVPTETVLVYSSLGEPQTIAGGDTLVESSTTFSFNHVGLPSGKWAYYSLFVHYESTTGDSYYERAASIAILLPNNYGSTEQLWRRIPEYYRIQDTNLGTTDFSDCIGYIGPNQRVGPLYKYLSIIGFDIDRIRTIIDYVIVSADPSVATSETLEALGLQMASLLRVSDLGAQRLRSVVEDVGRFRRSKGTLFGTKFFTKAVTGAEVEFDTQTGDVVIYSQRVNYVTNPVTGTGIVTSRAAHEDEATLEGQLPFSDTTYDPTYAGSYSNTGSLYTTTGTGIPAGVRGVWLRIDSRVPVKTTGEDRVMFSLHSGFGSQGIKAMRLVDGAETVIGWADTPISVNGVLTFEAQATGASAGGGWLDTYVEVYADLTAVPAVDFSYLLVERNNFGRYFDGNTVRGGWLIDSSSVSDYRWSASANSSPSIFAEDYERTKSIVNQLLYEVLPITELSKYNIVSFNAIPGY
jgi:hypothetical protein